MKKYIYIKANKETTFFNRIKDFNIEQYYNVKGNNLIIRVFNKLKLSKKLFWNKKWKKNIQDYDLVILGENNYDFEISKYIRKVNPKARIIVYFWNAMNSYYETILKDKEIDEFWTFDKRDADLYNLKYNPQFYSKNVVLKKLPNSMDVLFLGRAKNRKDNLLKIKKMFDKNGIRNDIRIIENENDLIKYDDYLDMLATSKCVLDIVEGTQVGLTLRCMESIFLDKKLITNNSDIKNYDFYNYNNVFILGEDDISKINQFIDSPYEKINQKIIDYYDFESWIKRFEVQ